MMRDWLARWKSRYFVRPRGANVRRLGRSFRPQVHFLENRIVPSTYTAAPTFAAGHLPKDAVVADFNGDGKLDIAFANTPANIFDPAVNVVFGNGNGTFQTPVGYNTVPFGQDGTTVSLTVGDFNGDGKPDLAAAVFGSNEIVIMPNDGNGGFTAPGLGYVSYPTDGAPTHVLAGDFNGDGKLDLVVSTAANSALEFFAGKGDGTFVRKADILTDFVPLSLAAGDFNNDGHLDLAVTGGVNGGLDVLLGNGDGTFHLPKEYGTINPPNALATADLNGDGKPDIVVAGGPFGAVEVFPGNGDGTFGTPVSYATDIRPTAVAITDLNQDGHPDVVTANGDGGSVDVLVNKGDGTFNSAVTYAADNQPSAVVVGDFDRDGLTDVAVSNSGSDNFSLLIGNGNGTLQAALEFPAGPGSPSDAVQADINGDGHQDLVVTNPATSTISVLLGNGDGTFQAPIVTSTGFGTIPDALAVTDLNGDGVPDVITADLNGTLSVLLGNGDGTFKPAVLYGAGSTPTAMVLGDFNRDGHTDVALANSTGANTVTVLLGKGDGTFGSSVGYAVGGDPVDLAAADMNKDGKLDLVVADASSSSISVLLGNGDGTFQTSVNYSLGYAPSAIAAGDLNQDGLPDLVVGDATDQFLVSYVGFGDGTFGLWAFQQLLNGTVPFGPPASIRLADVNHDGYLDAVVGTSAGNDIAVALGVGDTSFRTPIILSAGPNPERVAIGDFNKDGLTDLAAADSTGNNVTILRALPPTDTFRITAPSMAVPGVPFQITVTVVTPYGLPDVHTLDNIHFTSSDAVAGLPDDYAFQPVDKGTHTFTVTLFSDGLQSITVNDRFAINPAGSAKVFVPDMVHATNEPAGSKPIAVVTGDFNRDGKADLAFADAGSGSIMVELGAGNGSFGTPISYPIAGGVGGLAVGDFDKDGRSDLIVTNPTGNTITVFLSNPDGTLFNDGSYAAGLQPGAIVTGDFNNDGNLDVAVADGGANTISVLLGNGDGTFQAAKSVPTGFAPNALVAGQFNSDGNLDLAATGGTGVNGLEVLLGNGDGTFQAAAGYSTLAGADGLATADLVGNGRLDLVVASATSSSIQTFLGNGDGTFAAGAITATAAGPVDPLLADFNADGHPDLVVADSGSDTVEVFLNNGLGAFLPAITYVADAGPGSMVSADFNRDGIPDLVVANGVANDFTTLLGNGEGRFKAAREFAAGTGPFATVVADVNGDGNQDVLVSNPGTNSLTVLLGKGDNTFMPGPTLAVGTAPRGLAVADLTGNGIQDIVVADSGSNDVAVLLGTGGGAFQSAVYYAVGTQPSYVTVADLNHDGKPDLIVTNSGSGTVSVLLGNGDGTFQPAASYAVGTNPGQVVAADFNEDQNLDLAVVNAGSANVSVLLGNGDGTFLPAVNYAAGANPMGLAVADYNKDDRADLIVANNGSGTFSVLPGRGNGSFGAPEAFGLPTMNPSDVHVADFNKDGNPDVIIGSSTGNAVYVVLGNGDGSFQSPLPYTTGSQPARLALGDFNADGFTDAAVADNGDNYVTILATPSPLPDQLTVAVNRTLPGQPFNFTVTAHNPFGAVDTVYLGTVHFSSTDPNAILPGDYTFQPGDAGSHTFTITLFASGRPDITVTDTAGKIAPVTTAVPVESGLQLVPIPDQTLPLSQGSLTLTVPTPTDADGDLITFAQPVVSGYNPAYDLQQLLNLYQKGGSYYQNAQHLNEKWLFSAVNGNRYAILPDGEVRLYNGSSLATSTTIATLDASYWLDPRLLTGATQPAAPAVTATLNTGTDLLTITPPAHYTGTFRVTLTGSDGLASASQSFLVTVTDNRPTLTPIPDQTMPHSQGSLQVTLSAADSDVGDTVSFPTPVISGYNPAYDLQQQLALYQFRTTAGGTYFQNSSQHLNEKWLFSALNSNRYAILPDGEVRLYNGSSLDTSSTIATLDPSVWVNPTLLTNAPAPVSPSGITASVTGNVLTVNVPTNYVGTFRVSVTASDGTLGATQSFLVHVTDNRPVLQNIADQTVAPGSGPLQLTLSAADPDAADTVSYLTPTISGSSAVYDLQRLLGLYEYQGPNGPTYFQSSTWGESKWLFSALTGNRYLITPTGQVMQYKTGVTSLAGLIQVAQLTPSVYANPTLLTAAVAPAKPTGVTASITGGVLTVTLPTGYVGTFRVTVAATDGALRSSQTFLVNVTAGTADDTPILAALSDISLNHTQEPIPAIALSVTDSDQPTTATAVSARTVQAGEAFDLQQQYGLYAYQGASGPNYFQSTEWGNGKWLFSALDGGRYLVMPTGRVLKYVANATSPGSLPPVAQLDPSVYVDPTLITGPALLPISSEVSSGSLTLTPQAAGQTGTFWTTVLATDGFHLTQQRFLITITNSSPLVGASGTTPPSPLPDVTVGHGSGPITVSLATADSDDPTAAILQPPSITPAGPAADLQRQLGLYQYVGTTGPTYLQNTLGQNEKWLFSAVNGNRYLILPTGEVRQFIPGVTQNFAQTTHYANLDASYWLDPNLIYAPPALAVTATITGNVLTVTPGTHYTGSFWVTIQATDGLTMTSQRFLVTVTDSTPLVGNLPIIVQPKGNTMTVPLNVSDPDGDTVQLSPPAVATASPAVQLQQHLALYQFGGSYYFNAQGLKEKWLFSAVNGGRYAILPDGTVRVYNGTSLATSPTIATLDPSYYADPALLTNPAAPAVDVNLSGTTLTITPSSTYTGAFTISVFASDGIRFTQQSLQVSLVPST